MSQPSIRVENVERGEAGEHPERLKCGLPAQGSKRPMMVVEEKEILKPRLNAPFCRLIKRALEESVEHILCEKIKQFGLACAAHIVTDPKMARQKREPMLILVGGRGGESLVGTCNDAPDLKRKRLLHEPEEVDR